MGFLRFRRSFRVASGIRLNFSKSGASTSLGTRGVTLNIHGNQVRGTVGIPGTGLSYQERQRTSDEVGVALAVLIALALLATLVM